MERPVNTAFGRQGRGQTSTVMVHLRGGGLQVVWGEGREGCGGVVCRLLVGKGASGALLEAATGGASAKSPVCRGRRATAQWPSQTIWGGGTSLAAEGSRPPAPPGVDLVRSSDVEGVEFEFDVEGGLEGPAGAVGQSRGRFKGERGGLHRSLGSAPGPARDSAGRRLRPRRRSRQRLWQGGGRRGAPHLTINT
jgi:hypothetical protein